MTQTGQKVQVREGRYAGATGTVEALQRPWLVVSLDRDPAVRLAVLHEEVRFVDERDERERAWKEVA